MFTTAFVVLLARAGDQSDFGDLPPFDIIDLVPMVKPPRYFPGSSVACYEKLVSMYRCTAKVTAEYTCAQRLLLFWFKSHTSCKNDLDCQFACYKWVLSPWEIVITDGLPHCTAKEQLMIQHSGYPTVIVETKNNSENLLVPVVHLDEQFAPANFSGTAPHPVSHLGDPQACMNTDGMRYCLLDTPTYRQGLCRPSECGDEDVRHELESFALNYNRTLSQIELKPNFSVSCRHMGDPAPEAAIQWSFGEVAASAVILVLCGLVALGTALDLCKRWKVPQPYAAPFDFLDTRSDNQSDIGGALLPASQPRSRTQSAGFNGEVFGNLSSTPRSTREDWERGLIPAGGRSRPSDAAETSLQETPWARGRAKSTDRDTYFDGTPLESSVADSSRVRSHQISVDPATPESASAVGQRRGAVAQAGVRGTASDPWAKRYVLEFVHFWSASANLDTLASIKTGSQAGHLGMLHFLRPAAVLSYMFLSCFFLPMDSVGYRAPESIYPPKGVMSSFWFQLVALGWFSCDTLLWLAGFLAAMDVGWRLRRGGSNLTLAHFCTRFYPLAVLCQWLRLTPALAFVCMFSSTWFKSLGTGLLWTATCISSASGPGCDDWWRKVVYVDNLIPRNNDAGPLCLPHMYLPLVEMQLFLIVPILALLRERFGDVAGHVCVWTLVAASAVGTISIVLHEDVPSDPYLGGRAYWDNVYIKPWCRAQPYLIGIATAWLHESLPVYLTRRAKSARDALMEQDRHSGPDTTGFFGPYGRNRAPFGRAWTAWLMQLIAFAVLFGVALLPLARYGRGGSALVWSSTTNAIYGALSHAVWALAGATLALMCSLRMPSTWWINLLFSGQNCRWAGRLSYSAYLVHPLVIVYALCESGTVVTFSWVALCVLFVSCAVVSFVLALLIWLLVERPGVALAMAIVAPAKAAS